MFDVINAYTGEIYFTSPTKTEALQAMRNRLLKEADVEGDPRYDDFGDNCIFAYDARGTTFHTNYFGS